MCKFFFIIYYNLLPNFVEWFLADWVFSIGLRIKTVAFNFCHSMTFFVTLSLSFLKCQLVWTK